MNKTDSGFGIKDYYAMLRYDFRAPFIYFYERHLFDLLNNTDTHKRLLVDDYDASTDDLNHAFNHSCSWTSSIKISINFIAKFLDSEIEKYSFFDIGSGKGKVLLTLSTIPLDKNFYSYGGVEINSNLREIAKKNFKVMGIKDCRLSSESAKTINLGEINQNLVLYLYNPFDEHILEEFIKNQKTDNCFIIYNNPVYSEIILKNGFSKIFEKSHYMTNGRITIFYKN